MAGSLDRSDGTLLNRYSGHTNRQFKLGACLSHDDALVLSGSEDGSLYVSGCRRGGSRCSRDQAAVSCEDLPPVGLGHLVEARLQARIPAARGAVTSVACDPRRLEVLTGSHDGAVKLFTPG